MPRLSERLAIAVREAVLLIILAAAASGLSIWVRGGLPQRPAPEPGGDVLALEEAMRLGPLWIDARAGERYHAEHIPGALPLETARYEELLPAVLEGWDAGRAAVVYGDAPGEADSREVAARLCDFKVGRVCVLKGGWMAWKSR